ncbi:MAG: hypothetical protein GY716_03915 [bacterium]|nr:hypothetical protein [bacterium]
MAIEALLDALAASSVNDWSIYGTESRRLSLGIKDREAGNAHAPLSLAEGCGARYLIVWDDGLVSHGYFERGQLAADPRKALDHAREAAYDDPDAAQVLGPAEMPQVQLHDATTAEVAGGDTRSIARRLARIRERVATGGIRTWSGSFGASEAASRLVTSAGLDVAARGTAFGWHVSLNGEAGDGFGAREPESDDDFEARLERLFDISAQLSRDAEPMPGGSYPVILHPRVVEQYALSTLLHSLDGSTVDHGEGRFRIAQFGSDETVLREDLTLRVDPLKPMRSGSYRFTASGLPAAPCTYVERGRLVRPVLGLKYAKRLGLEPTPLPYGMDTLHLEGPTPLTLDEAMREADGGALILSVLGVHTQDSSSGDFSLSAPQALAVTRSGFDGRLRGTISGNLFDTLRSDGLRLVRVEGEHTPGLLFPCRFDPK